VKSNKKAKEKKQLASVGYMPSCCYMR